MSAKEATLETVFTVKLNFTEEECQVLAQYRDLLKIPPSIDPDAAFLAHYLPPLLLAAVVCQIRALSGKQPVVAQMTFLDSSAAAQSFNEHWAVSRLEAGA